MIENNPAGFYLSTIDCIKLVRNISNCGLVEGKVIVEKFFYLSNIDCVDNRTDFNKLMHLAVLVKDEAIRVIDNSLMINQEFGINEYDYIIDLNERGSFQAHVENHKTGKIVFSFNNENNVYNDEGEIIGTEEGELQIVEDGFMKDIEDMQGLENYLIDMEVIPEYTSIRFVG